jgi:hypothetical protein
MREFTKIRLIFRSGTSDSAGVNCGFKYHTMEIDIPEVLKNKIDKDHWEYPEYELIGCEYLSETGDPK